MKNSNRIYLIFFLVLLFNTATSQSDVLNAAGDALKKGDAGELTKHFNDIVEISFKGEKSSYSKTQAEFILKDFFRKYPVSDFNFIHKGSSKEGLQYAIGKYKHANGSYRVYILVKQAKGRYVIDTLNFSNE